MKKLLLLLAIPMLFVGLSAQALAARTADLSVSISPPSGVHVYETGTYTATVQNKGTRTANGVVLAIVLPETNTSPTVHIMGALSGHSSECTQSGSVLTCSLGRIRKDKASSVSFDIAFPYSTAPLVIDLHATTTTTEGNPADNSLAFSATPLTYDVPVNAGVSAVNRHCSGTDLTSFFECELYPSSISAFDSVLLPGGDISVTSPTPPPGFSGQWTQTAPDALHIQFFDNNVLSADLQARGVGGGCFEGVMTFPNSQWIAVYEVCLQ